MAAGDPTRPALHMVLRVDLPEGRFLADVGFGNLTPTAPLAWRAHAEQATPHETMRLVPAEDDMILQALVGDEWESLYRVMPQAWADADYEVANWFAATHPNSIFTNNLIVARVGPAGARHTFLNGRVTVRRPPDQMERRMLEDVADYLTTLVDAFGLALSADEVDMALATIDQKGRRGAVLPAFR
jgi:N-hydroxyarylamine O-acetyltransferase